MKKCLIGAITWETKALRSGSLCYHRDRPAFGPDDRGDRAERLIDELNLTDAQVEQIRVIRQGAREEMQALHANLRVERQNLHELMASDATAADLRAQPETVQTRHRQVADQRFENMLAVREVLTLEQRAELSELMEQRRENRQDFRRDRRVFQNRSQNSRN